MPGASFLALICERTGVSADWLLMGRGGESVVPWTASRSREELEQDLAIHVHAHIRRRDNEGRSTSSTATTSQPIGSLMAAD